MGAAGLCASEQQNAQLSQRDRAMFRITKCFAKSLKVTFIRIRPLSRACIWGAENVGPDNSGPDNDEPNYRDGQCKTCQ